MKEQDVIEATILMLLENRGTGKTICPSEVVKKIYPENWRDKIDLVKEIGITMRDSGKIFITQKGYSGKGEKIESNESNE